MATESGREAVNITFEQWETALERTLREVEADTRAAEERFGELQARLTDLKEERAQLERAVLAAKATVRNADTPRSRVRGDTLREVLIINHADEDGVVRGAGASSHLHKIEYFPNRRAADSAVYTTLRKPPFLKIEKGVYRIPKESPEWRRLREANGNQPGLNLDVPPNRVASKFIKSGLAELVATLLKKHPDWDRRHVTDFLIQSGWDFGGKNPNFAVSMAFSRLALTAKAEDMPPGRGHQQQPQRRPA